MIATPAGLYFFFFNDTATTEIYTLSLHDALPIYRVLLDDRLAQAVARAERDGQAFALAMFDLDRFKLVNDSLDRKSTRLNSSHGYISYAVFSLQKKHKQRMTKWLQQGLYLAVVHF